MPAHKVEPEKRTCTVCGKGFLVGGRGNAPLKQTRCSRRCLAFSRIRQPVINHLSDVDAAYIAGMFDGEGSIILWYRRGDSARPQLRCTVSNTHFPMLEWVKDRVGTGSVVRHRYPDATGYKEAGTWQCYGQNAVALLNQMLPYLIVKRDKAIDAIASQIPDYSNLRE
jgi:hypothetical protein